ncbi:DUF2000 family protein [Streptomyces sp. AHA2]|uniref:DUF2000 family protein n=1 Tax=Streptomyces sp. AHA2 TaxID=3064526 RepID=UPI003FA68A1E
MRRRAARHRRRPGPAPRRLANAVSVTGLIVGASMPHLLGTPREDADGTAHSGTYTTGLPVLRADRAELSRICDLAVQRGVGLCEFPAVAQTTDSCAELTELVASTPTKGSSGRPSPSTAPARRSTVSPAASPCCAERARAEPPTEGSRLRSRATDGEQHACRTASGTGDLHGLS